MVKMVIFMLLAAFLMGLALLAMFAIAKFIQNHRNQKIADDLNNTIKTAEASNRIDELTSGRNKGN